MLIEYADDFKRSIKKLRDAIALKRLEILIDKLENANSLADISNVVSIANHPFIYRIRTGDYRLLVEYIDGNITILLIKYLKRDDNTYREYR